MHGPNDTSATAFDRGYENWMMEEARKRNPDIHLSGTEAHSFVPFRSIFYFFSLLFAGLIWGVPGWVTEKTFFSDENIDYQVKWLTGLKEKKNLTVNSIGVGYNEHGFDSNFIKKFRPALQKAGMGGVRTIAADQCCGGEYNIVDKMLKVKPTITMPKITYIMVWENLELGVSFK